MIGDEIPQVGLPFMSFMAIGCVGLAEGQKAKFKELERQKRYVEPEKAEDILAKMRGQKVGKEEYKMVSVPGHTGGAYDNMSEERLKQELQALRASEKWTGLPLDDKKKEVKQLLEKKGAWFGLR